MLVSHLSFHEETVGGVAKCQSNDGCFLRLISQVAGKLKLVLFYSAN